MSISNRIWGRSCWICVAGTPAWQRPLTALGQLWAKSVVSSVPGFTLEAVKPLQFSAHQPISNLLLEPRPFTLTWSQLMLNLHDLQKVAFGFADSSLKSQAPCQVSGEVVGSNRQWWLLLHLVIPLHYPQWQGSTDFSTRYQPPELCEAVNDDKSSAARGGRCHRLILAEQMAVKEEAVLISAGFLDPRATGSFPKMQEPWHSFWLLTKVVTS